MVDVIIPIYNTYDFIGETLDSILKQTYINKIKVYLIMIVQKKRKLIF